MFENLSRLPDILFALVEAVCADGFRKALKKMMMLIWLLLANLIRQKRGQEKGELSFWDELRIFIYIGRIL